MFVPNAAPLFDQRSAPPTQSTTHRQWANAHATMPPNHARKGPLLRPPRSLDGLAAHFELTGFEKARVLFVRSEHRKIIGFLPRGFNPGLAAVQGLFVNTRRCSRALGGGSALFHPLLRFGVEATACTLFESLVLFFRSANTMDTARERVRVQRHVCVLLGALALCLSVLPLAACDDGITRMDVDLAALLRQAGLEVRSIKVVAPGMPRVFGTWRLQLPPQACSV